jgi:L-lactate dehydrogenase complex protein LldG
MTHNSREEILNRLRASLENKMPFEGVATHNRMARLPVTKIDDDENLRKRFIIEVERVRGVVHPAENETDALSILRGLLRQKNAARVTMWDERHLPIAGVESLMREMNVTRVEGDNEAVASCEVGITGCDWAIASTGTIVLTTGDGRGRMASLLPPIHIALVRTSQLIPRLEDFVAGQYGDKLQRFRVSSNITLITGCSRTADIEMSPVFGVHGPLEFHIILIKE